MLLRANSILRTNIVVSSPPELPPARPHKSLLLQSSEDGTTHLVDLVDLIIRARRLSAARAEPQDKTRRPSEQKKRVSIASATSVLSVPSIPEEEPTAVIPTMVITSSDEEEGRRSTSSSSSSRQLVARSMERQQSEHSSQFRRSESANSLDARLRLITVDGMLASEQRIARPLTPPSTLSGRSSSSPAPSLARDADDNRSFRKRFFRSGSLSEKVQEGIQRRASVVKKLKSAVRRPSSIRF